MPVTTIFAPHAGACHPQIAVNSSGKAIAVWYQNDGNRNNIWAAGFNGTSWEPAVNISVADNNTGNAEYPQIAIDSSGNAIAVWKQNDGTRESIYANRFD